MTEAETKTEKEIKQDSRGILDHAGELLETYYQYVSVALAQKTINLASSVIHSFTVAILAVIVFSFLGLGVAWWLGEIMNNHAGGFFIVAGVYLLIMILLVLARKKLFAFLSDLITKKIYE